MVKKACFSLIIPVKTELAILENGIALIRQWKIVDPDHEQSRFVWVTTPSGIKDYVPGNLGHTFCRIQDENGYVYLLVQCTGIYCSTVRPSYLLYLSNPIRA